MNTRTGAARFRLPTSLATDSDIEATLALTRYYGHPYLGDGADVGAHFDSIESIHIDWN